MGLGEALDSAVVTWFTGCREGVIEGFAVNSLSKILSDFAEGTSEECCFGICCSILGLGVAIVGVCLSSLGVCTLFFPLGSCAFLGERSKVSSGIGFRLFGLGLFETG